MTDVLDLRQRLFQPAGAVVLGLAVAVHDEIPVLLSFPKELAPFQRNGFLAMTDVLGTVSQSDLIRDEDELTPRLVPLSSFDSVMSDDYCSNGRGDPTVAFPDFAVVATDWIALP